jgi:hypothetical protein
MRIMRQAIEMWAGGIDYLSKEMGLRWMREVDFRITVDAVGNVDTYPVVDPEIVVIAATHPTGALGIGIDPVESVFVDPNVVPCLPVDNPFDIEQWEALPGFNDHHQERSGTYNEDCGDTDRGQSGGNVCFAVNTALDPAPDAIELVSLFDIVAHEFGHCLTVGHVGDGAEGLWGALPTNDIMAYHDDPPGLNKCVSTLNVEGLATVMSRYLDVDGDGTAGDEPLLANDQAGEGGNPFQIQHPRDHLYASTTGSPLDCPQPDLGLVPGEPTDWTPETADLIDERLTVTSPNDGATDDDGALTVAGTVERIERYRRTGPGPTASFDDPDDDAKTPEREIEAISAALDPTTVRVTVDVADLPADGAVPGTYFNLLVNEHRFDSSFAGGETTTYDSTTGEDVPTAAGGSTWDPATDTVTFELRRDYLAAQGVAAPYRIGVSSAFDGLAVIVYDDWAPPAGSTITVDDGSPSAPTAAAPATSATTAAESSSAGQVVPAGRTELVHEGGNHFTAEESSPEPGATVNAHVFMSALSSPIVGPARS